MLSISQIRRMKKKGDELSDEDLQRLSTWWRSGGTSEAEDAEPEDIFSFSALGLPSPTEVVTPVTDLSQCFVCGKPVDQTTGTEGVTHKIIGFKLELDPKDNIYKKIPIMDTAHVRACYDHCLMIKPSVDKYGAITSSNMKWGNFSGE